MQVQQVEITPDPYEPFLLAQAHRVGELLFVSGQAGIGADGEIVGPGEFDKQAEQAFANLDRVLRAGGSSLANVVKVGIFVTDMLNFDKVVERRRSIRPTRCSRSRPSPCSTTRSSGSAAIGMARAGRRAARRHAPTRWIVSWA
jgi:enamine deaminase RidA (YjgF/YER057c/UK114 family)